MSEIKLETEIKTKTASIVTRSRTPKNPSHSRVPSTILYRRERIPLQPTLMPNFRPILFALFFAPILHASIISGTVKDSTGSLTPRAHIEISGATLNTPLSLDADSQGHFASPDLTPGSYTLKITAEGFELNTLTLDLASSNRDLAISLQIATLRQEVTVEAKSNHANNDSVYRQLRDIAPGSTFQVKDAALKYDVGTFYFTQGTLTFLAPVSGFVTGAIFIGHGHFALKPVQPIEQREFLRRTQTEQLDEEFTSVVFRYTGNLNRNFLSALHGPGTEPAVAATLAQWQEKVRHRREIPLGFTEDLLAGSNMDNIDADLLSWIYNPILEHSLFEAFIHGVKHKDLRFYVRNRGGAIPDLGSPEEVGFVNYDPEGMDDGVWYLNHLQSEFTAGAATSHEERRFVAARKFKVETVIGNNDHLTSVATVTFEPLLAGERVVRFQLLPNLRVARVTGAQGKELLYLQESRKADGSFYVILPQPAELKKEYSLTIEYQGDKVITKAGNGSFYIGAREAWYPNLNDFSERALYDLTFRVPKRYHLISVGDLQSEAIEDNQNVTHWLTPKPIAVAGFNYGDYRKIEIRDEQTATTIDGFYLPELPDMLAHNPAVASMAPGGMTKYVLDQTRAQLEVCTLYFGKSPFTHISITEQPNFNFGQSWPELVYLPISAYIDSTQRYMLYGAINNSLTAFVDEVTPHEVAHQWWGHAVGWASYHDQWLSEGFAEFSAGLFLQQAMGPKWEKDYIQFWERLKKRILDKNQFGVAPNDAGPIWLGLRLMSPRSASGYQNVVYPKGAYILSMLRSLMYTNKDHDNAFIEMMHDFVDAHRDMPASTESFKAIAEKHMSRAIDFENNGRLDWFFREWVYGTEVPRYKLEYQLTPTDGGKSKLHLTITQSEVGNGFVMLVPLFADFGKGFVRLGQLPMIGNSTKDFDFDMGAQPKKIALNAYKEILER